MVKGFWGIKVGMAQVFDKSVAISVTAIDPSHWVIVGLKSVERDGYSAVRVGKVKKRYCDQAFSLHWLKKMKQYFTFIKEIKAESLDDVGKIGDSVKWYNAYQSGNKVSVTGTTKGSGFSGVVKRYGFSGGAASHGNMMGRRPGSIGFMCKSGRVMKGKKLPGQMGNVQRTVQGIAVVRVEKDPAVIMLKGSVPGRPGSLVFVRT